MKSWFKPCLSPQSLAIASLLMTMNTHAAMSLDKMIVYFEPDKSPRQDIVVTNPDQENLYLQTEVYKVVNPGTEQEERVRVTNPSELKLLSTPQKAIVAPNSRKTVRLVSLETPKKTESVYRVTFKPVVGDLEATQNAIKLLIAYQTLVFVRPESPEYKVTAKREKDSITFTNSGNINVVLRNGQFCSGQKSKRKCSDIDDIKRLYAGQSWTLKVPNSKTEVEYGLFNGSTEERKTF
ncbi:fimbrial biogenesis chaperone [Endozoicomonas numazuensis]|uniref:fimbrial biogenesis chaperone n=1 Tax=Endozoicomonas numazuensis TaxID=1137799 RepID=UPI0013765B53|nr:fimbria/pilus periplasmic chaperone [Endozoicomonas numazuensis]